MLNITSEDSEILAIIQQIVVVGMTGRFQDVQRIVRDCRNSGIKTKVVKQKGRIAKIDRVVPA